MKLVKLKYKKPKKGMLGKSMKKLKFKITK